MEFNKGDMVEVWRRDDLMFGSWWSAKIISTYDHTFCVRYERLINSDGSWVVNAVDSEDLRPLQTPPGGGESLMAGDMVEVFDCLCWRIGEIIKVLSRDWFVVRLGNSNNATKAHKSNIRLQKVWDGSKWAFMSKDGVMKKTDRREMHTGENYYRRVDICARKICINEECTGDNFVEDTINPSSTKTKRFQCSVSESCHDEENGHTLHIRKMRRTEKVGECKGPARSRLPPLPKKVDAVSFVGTHVVEKHLHTSFNGQTFGSYISNVAREDLSGYAPSCFTRSVNVSEESSGSSIASCSSNNLQSYTYNRSRTGIRKSLKRDSEDDAMSTCESHSGKKYLGASWEELAVKVHELELHAYHSTLQAFYASGPLNWNQEAILTDLRLFLNISNDEHLSQLRNILNSQELCP